MKPICLAGLFPFIFLASVIAQPIVSYDFENWNNGITLPGWSSSPFGAGRTDTAHSGNSAIAVWNWYYYSKGYFYNDTENSYLPSPNIFPYHRGEAISFAPLLVSGYYRYVPGDNNAALDSAWIRITLTRFNSQTMQSDSIGAGIIKLAFSSTYIPFQFPINYYTANIPDTFLISVVSSVNGFCNTSGNGTCLYLSVDNLSLVTETGLAIPVMNQPMSIKNNQTLSILNQEGGLVSIYDVSGKLYKREAIRKIHQEEDITCLPPGLYIAHLIRNNKRTTLKFSR